MNYSAENMTTSFILGSPVGNNCGNITAIDMLGYIAVVADLAIGFVSNVVIIFLLLSNKEGIVTTDIFAFNLAFSELIVCPCIIVALLFHINVVKSLIMYAFNFFFGFVQMSRPLFRCCICVDRYFAVVHPIVYLKHREPKYKLALLASVWLLTVGICAVNTTINISFMMTAVFVPVLAVDSFCSLSILRALMQPRPGDGEREEINLTKRRAFRTVLVIQVMMVINYLPMILLSSLSALVSPQRFCQLFSAAFTLFILGSFVDPVLYLSRASPCTKLKQALFRK